VQESLKTATVGLTGSSLTWLDWLPPVVGIVGGILTAIYISIKIYKEIK
tara:strand:- start:413 stop:559 length:147 start_codon:yes stop_codon:yes gene_type:complete